MIVISPYSTFKKGLKGVKDYPYWNALISKIKETFPDEELIQIGKNDEKPLIETQMIVDKSMPELLSLVRKCRFWISVDNFFPHLCSVTDKKGFVIFAYTDPKIFGYPQNVNILKSVDWLRKEQFLNWDGFRKSTDAFLSPKEIIDIIVKEESNL